MLSRSASLLVSLALFTPLAACASPRTAGETSGSAEVTCEWESWPPPSPQKAAPAATSTTTVTLMPKDGGYRIDELLEHVAKATGVSFLYDSSNATFKQSKVEVCGSHVIPEDELFAWLQAVLSYRKLVLVPVGPKASDGKQQWMIMDQADPNLKCRPVFLNESEVLDYADRDGLYVVASLRVRDTVDTTRVRNALSPLSTQTAGIGRIQDIPGSRTILVADFAPVVAAMKRLLDIINAEAVPATPRRIVVPAAPTAVPAPRPDK